MKELALSVLLLACTVSSAPLLAAGDPQAGAEKSKTCSACHGPEGNSSDPQYPRLAGQYPDYLTHALHAYKTGARQNAIMNGFAATLSDQDIADLAAYFSGQQGLVAPRLERFVN